jgi:pimeloyl-ACP methyl ester carboxylesterase
VALAAAAALVLAGCGGGGGKDAGPKPGPSAAASPIVAHAVSPIEPEPASDPAFAALYAQQVSWSRCESTFQCAKVTVPIDWALPTGPTLTLALMRLSATDPARRIGSMLINPGGPGASGLDLVRSATDVFDADVRARYDIVGFDPRGVGTSDPVHCLSAAKLNKFLTIDAAPDTPAELAALQSIDQQFAQGCVARSGALLPHVGTRDAARDMDVIRAVLRDDKLNFFGYSYGTYLGSFYAGMFPQRVGRFVLDGALDPSLDSASLTEVQAAGFQDAFDRFADHCAQTTQCPIGDSRQDITDRVVGFFDKLNAAPLRTGKGRLLTEADAVTGLAYAMYLPELWDTEVNALADAYAGRGDILLGLADQLLSRDTDGSFKDNSNEANYAVNCLDHPGDDTAAEAQATLPALKAASVVFGVHFAFSSLPCAWMPAENPIPVPGPIRASGAAPILVVGTTHDPATPYAWARALANQLESGVLLTRDGDGHTAYGRGNTCVDGAVDAYLLTGRPPKNGTTC